MTDTKKSLKERFKKIFKDNSDNHSVNLGAIKKEVRATMPGYAVDKINVVVLYSKEGKSVTYIETDNLMIVS
jgi:hypothetical protein